MDLIIDFTYKQPVKGALCNNRTKEILHFNTFQLISLAFVLQHFSRTPIHLKKAHDLVLPYQNIFSSYNYFLLDKKAMLFFLITDHVFQINSFKFDSQCLVLFLQTCYFVQKELDHISPYRDFPISRHLFFAIFLHVETQGLVTMTELALDVSMRARGSLGKKVNGTVFLGGWGGGGGGREVETMLDTIGCIIHAIP